MSTGVTATLAALLVIWLAAKLGGEVMERLGQPAVLGELLAGVLIGPGVLGLVRETEVLQLLAEIGVVLLLFEIGLESDLDELLKAGTQSTAVAVAGVACPFIAGFALAAWWGKPTLVAVFIGAMLTATVVAIASKLAAGLAVYRRGIRRWVVGVGMVPRGEVGLIFAGLSLASGVIEPTLYAGLVGMVMVTTFVVPPWLKVLYRRA